MAPSPFPATHESDDLKGGVLPLAVVVPCHDEARRLDPASFQAFARAHPEWGLVFVDDGSTDGTAEVLRGLPGEVVSLPANRGKAEAVRAGMRRALERPGLAAVAVYDADLSTPLEEVERQAAVLVDQPGLDAVFGSRVKLLGADIERRALRFLAGRAFATACAQLLGLPAYDTQCGAKLWRATGALRAALEAPFEAPWLYELELLARLGGAVRSDGSLRAVELPVARWHHVGGSQVGPLDLPRSLGALLRLRRRYGRLGP